MAERETGRINAVTRNYPVRAAFVERVWLPEFSERQARVILDGLMQFDVTTVYDLDDWALFLGYRSVDEMLRSLASVVIPGDDPLDSSDHLDGKRGG